MPCDLNRIDFLLQLCRQIGDFTHIEEFVLAKCGPFGRILRVVVQGRVLASLMLLLLLLLLLVARASVLLVCLERLDECG